MALPDYSDLDPGTPVEWSTTGGRLITLTSLANDAAREGAKSATWLDATRGFPEVVKVVFQSAPAVAVTGVKEVELHVGESDSAVAGTDNPGGLTGADAAVTTPAEKTPQLVFVGSLMLGAALGTAVQRQVMAFRPRSLHSVPVVVNKAGVALSGTAADHKITLTPYYRRIKD